MSELREKLRKGLEGVTPGPWEARIVERDGELRDCFVQAPDVNGFAYKAEILGEDEYREEGGGLARKKADVLHIALCSPENIRTLLDELDRVEKERDAFSEAFAREQQTVRDIVAAAGPRDEEHDIFDHLKAMRGLIEQAVRALEQAPRAINASYMQMDAEWRDHDATAEKHGAVVQAFRELVTSTLSLLKASRPQNREETDAENERIS